MCLKIKKFYFYVVISVDLPQYANIRVRALNSYAGLLSIDTQWCVVTSVLHFGYQSQLSKTDQRSGLPRTTGLSLRYGHALVYRLLHDASIQTGQIKSRSNRRRLQTIP